MAIRTANNQSLTEITAIPSDISLGGLVLLETQTASSDSTIDFTSNIDSTYDEYIFKYINMHPEEDDKHFMFQADTGTNTSYNQTITSSAFITYYSEDGTTGTGVLAYSTPLDQRQGTDFQILATGNGYDNDQDACGTLHLFNPSSGTFVKHWFSESHNNEYRDGSHRQFMAGYFNTTTAITRVQFKMSSGNIDSGTFKLYGVT